MVCWALWLQSGEAEQIVHIRWPTETFAHARVDVKPMSISFMCIPSRNKAWIAAASSARPKYSAFRQLIMERWCGVLGAEQCWVLVAVFSELNGGSHKVANRNICSCLRRITSMSTVFMCIPCRKKAYIPATSFASANFSAYMQLIMMRWGGALGAEQCWAVCWACLLKSFGAEQILHTRWPTEIFAHACVEIKSMSTDFMCIPSRNKA